MAVSGWEQLYREAWIMDTSARPLTQDPLLPFVFEEWLCSGAIRLNRPLVHIWRHRGAVILGLRDSRLPRAGEAAEWLKERGYPAVVRNSGGAAVPLDTGVVNVSIILPKQESSIRHHEDFAAMKELIERAVGEAAGRPTLPIKAGEIAGGYCPGDYDLSLQGRKFCGIAQRRKLAAYAVQAFIVVEGSGAARASLIRDFYEAAADRGDESVPAIVPEATGSLSELASIHQASDWINGLYHVLRPDPAWVSTSYEQWLNPEQDLLPILAQMKERYGLSLKSPGELKK